MRPQYAGGGSSGAEFVQGLSVLCSWGSGHGRPLQPLRAIGDLIELPPEAAVAMRPKTSKADAKESFHGGRGVRDGAPLKAPSEAASKDRGRGNRSAGRTCVDNADDEREQRVLVAQTGGATGGRTKVWEVWLQPRKVASKADRSHRANLAFEQLVDSAASLASTCTQTAEQKAAAAEKQEFDAGTSLASDSVCTSSGDQGALTRQMGGAGGGGGGIEEDSLAQQEGAAKGATEGDGGTDAQAVGTDGMLLVFERSNPDTYISVSALHSARHDKFEATCCVLCCPDTASLAAARNSCLLYLGTSAGATLRFSFR